MIFKCSLGLSQELLRLPETGLGYQIIQNLIFHNQMPTLIQRYVIYNSEIIVELDEYFDRNKR